MISKYKFYLMWFIAGIVLISVFNHQPEQINNLLIEKEVLKNSYFGDFNSCKIQKKSGSIKLVVWEPWIRHVHENMKQFQSVLLNGSQKLSTEYDEIWISKCDELFTKKEKEKYKDQFDLNTLYWKDDKIQAATVEKFYKGNPLTAQNLLNPSHKIINIYNRVYILKNIN